MQIYLPPILAAEFDLQQIIFVVVFLGIAFLQWLFKVFKEQAEAKERAKQPPPSAEEIEARRRAWQEQTVEYDEEEREDIKPVAPQQRPAPAPSLPGGLGDILETLRKNLEEQNRPAPAPAPPPLPAAQPQVNKRPVVTVTPPTPVVVKEPVPTNAYTVSKQASEAFALPKPATAITEVRSRHSAHPLAEFLRTTHGYRRAFILKEVLSPPKAMQSNPWSSDS